MSTVAIIGAGPLGGALAHTLAARGRIGEVRLIDPEGRIAEGTALDILQSSPVEQFSTRVTAATSFAAAAGADAIVLADLVSGGEIAGEPGLALLRQLARMEGTSPLLFAGGSQREVMARAISELHLAPGRLLGSAPLALESAVRAVTAALVDVSPVDLSIGVAGVPPRDAVIGWDAATAFNQPIAAVLAPHHLSAISSRLPALWPPSPYALASAAARVAEALANGSRRRYTCFAAIAVTGAGRDMIAAVPVEIVKGGIGKTLAPALSRHERTSFENGLR
jgi:lactate/malate dehydrogenase, NAD binding domain